MVTIDISNHKGGTGKTALNHTLGYALASDHGQRVLMCFVSLVIRHVKV